MKAAGNLDVVRSTARPITDRPETEPDDTVSFPQGGNETALNFQIAAPMSWFGRDMIENIVQDLFRPFIQRRVVDFRLFQIAQPIVDAAIDIQHVHVLLNQFDGRQKPGAL